MGPDSPSKAADGRPTAGGMFEIGVRVVFLPQR